MMNKVLKKNKNFLTILKKLFINYKMSLSKKYYKFVEKKKDLETKYKNNQMSTEFVGNLFQIYKKWEDETMKNIPKFTKDINENEVFKLIEEISWIVTGLYESLEHIDFLEKEMKKYKQSKEMSPYYDFFKTVRTHFGHIKKELSDNPISEDVQYYVEGNYDQKKMVTLLNKLIKLSLKHGTGLNYEKVFESLGLEKLMNKLNLKDLDLLLALPNLKTKKLALLYHTLEKKRRMGLSIEEYKEKIKNLEEELKKKKEQNEKISGKLEKCNTNKENITEKGAIVGMLSKEKSEETTDISTEEKFSTSAKHLSEEVRILKNLIIQKKLVPIYVWIKRNPKLSKKSLREIFFFISQLKNADSSEKLEFIEWVIRNQYRQIITIDNYKNKNTSFKHKVDKNLSTSGRHSMWAYNKDKIKKILNKKYRSRINKDYGGNLTNKDIDKKIEMIAERNPIHIYKEYYKLYGKPDLYDSTKGGAAIWLPKTFKRLKMPWIVRVILVDRVVYHSDPVPHLDSVETVYHIGLPEKQMMEKRCDSVMLTPSGFTDPLMGNTHSRCHFEHANNITNYLITGINLDKITLEQAKKRYGPFIMAGMKGSKFYEEGWEKVIKMALQLYYEKKIFKILNPERYAMETFGNFEYDIFEEQEEREIQKRKEIAIKKEERYYIIWEQGFEGRKQNPLIVFFLPYNIKEYRIFVDLIIKVYEKLKLDPTEPWTQQKISMWSEDPESQYKKIGFKEGVWYIVPFVHSHTIPRNTVKLIRKTFEQAKPGKYPIKILEYKKTKFWIGLINIFNKRLEDLLLKDRETIIQNFKNFIKNNYSNAWAENLQTSGNLILPGFPEIPTFGKDLEKQN